MVENQRSSATPAALLEKSIKKHRRNPFMHLIEMTIIELDGPLPPSERPHYRIESARKYWKLCPDEELRSAIGLMSRAERSDRLTELFRSGFPAKQLPELQDSQQRREKFGLHAWNLLESSGFNPEDILVKGQNPSRDVLEAPSGKPLE